MTNLALIYLELGEHEKAREYIANAMEVDLRASDSYNLAVDYNNLGLISKNQGDSSKAERIVQMSIDCYGKALSLARGLRDRKGLPRRSDGQGAAVQVQATSRPTRASFRVRGAGRPHGGPPAVAPDHEHPLGATAFGHRRGDTPGGPQEGRG